MQQTLIQAYLDVFQEIIPTLMLHIAVDMSYSRLYRMFEQTCVNVARYCFVHIRFGSVPCCFIVIDEQCITSEVCIDFMPCSESDLSRCREQETATTFN